MFCYSVVFNWSSFKKIKLYILLYNFQRKLYLSTNPSDTPYPTIKNKDINSSWFIVQHNDESCWILAMICSYLWNIPQILCSTSKVRWKKLTNFSNSHNYNFLDFFKYQAGWWVWILFFTTFQRLPPSCQERMIHDIKLSAVGYFLPYCNQETICQVNITRGQLWYSITNVSC